MSYKLDMITQAIEHREKEIADYEVNIANFEHMVNAIGSEWPEDLAPYKNTSTYPAELRFRIAERIAQDKMRAELEQRIVAEMVERSKSVLVLGALIAQRQALLAEAEQAAGG